MKTKTAELDALLSAFNQFYRTLDATTLPADGGRVVGGIAHAVALSEATDALYGAMSAVYLQLCRQHGQTAKKHPPDSSVRVTAMEIGGHGADAVLLAALDSAIVASAFPIDKWNAMQKARPGANHQRFHAGELVSAASLAALKSAAKLLRMRSPQPKATAAGDDPSAYRPAKECIDRERFMTASAVNKFLNARPDIRTRQGTTKDGKPHPKRLLVHMGDWSKALASSPTPDDVSPRLADRLMQGVEARKAEAHAKKAATGKPDSTSQLFSLANKIKQKSRD